MSTRQKVCVCVRVCVYARVCMDRRYVEKAYASGVCPWSQECSTAGVCVCFDCISVLPGMLWIFIMFSYRAQKQFATSQGDVASKWNHLGGLEACLPNLLLRSSPWWMVYCKVRLVKCPLCVSSLWYDWIELSEDYTISFIFIPVCHVPIDTKTKGKQKVNAHLFQPLHTGW